MFDFKKKGGLIRDESQMMSFADTLDECGLHNIPAHGDPFTWCNMRQAADLILARLDRFECSFGWQEKFQYVVIEIWVTSGRIVDQFCCVFVLSPSL